MLNVKNRVFPRRQEIGRTRDLRRYFKRRNGTRNNHINRSHQKLTSECCCPYFEYKRVVRRKVSFFSFKKNI